MTDAPTDEERSFQFSEDDVAGVVALTGPYIVTHSLLENCVRQLLRAISDAFCQRMTKWIETIPVEQQSAFIRENAVLLPKLHAHLSAINQALDVMKECTATRNALAHGSPTAFRRNGKEPQLLIRHHKRSGMETFTLIPASIASDSVRQMGVATNSLLAATAALKGD